MYTLYHNKNMREIKVSKASKPLHNLRYKEEVTYYNDCYFICLTRKPLVEKAKEIKQKWIDTLETELDQIKQIKL